MNIETYISSAIEKQFPSLYLEDGVMLVELMKSYYEFLETQKDQYIFNNRRLYTYRDINQTLPDFVKFFRAKYMETMPSSVVDDRFVIKHILDLYRRKGTKEGIELFFKLFYNDVVNVSYPSEFVLKASDSIWVKDRYIEIDTNDLDLMQELNGEKIRGSVSLASANVDQIFFYTHGSKIYPILLISDLNGSFIVDETIVFGATSYGKIRGSLSEILNVKDIVGGSAVGDIVDIISPSGILAKARVSKLKPTVLGTLSDSKTVGYGYSQAGTTVYISTQLLRVPAGTNIKRNSLVVQGSSDGIALGLKTFFGNLYLGVSSEDTFTVNDITVDGVVYPVTFVTDRNSTVIFEEIYSPTTETAVRYNNDLLSSIPNIPAANLNSSHVSGSITSGLNTPLNVAFTSAAIPLHILQVSILDPGFDYSLDQFLFSYDSDLAPDSLPETKIISNASPVSIGSIVYQTSGARGYVLSNEENELTVLPISNIPFLPGGLYSNGIFYPSSDVSYIEDSRAIGSNQIETLETAAIQSPIDKLELLSSGYFYKNNDPVSISNDGFVLAIGVSGLGAVGAAEGRWLNETSHINRFSKVHDGSYYQQFSYVLTSNVPRETYLENLENIVHPVGTRVFSKKIISSIETAKLKITAVDL